jgi:ABC-2 type transport system permease protein
LTPSPACASLALLLRFKLRMLMNRFDQAARDAPIKLITTFVFVLLIWGGLYVLFSNTLTFIQKQVLEGIVAVPLVFQFFFIALAVMLVFSNAIIAYGGLFGRGEAEYLLAAPFRPRHIVTLRFFESLFFASWSLLLLGLPLMAAMARSAEAPWPFYAFFTAFFLCFVPIPAAVGLVAAWAAARFFPRSRVRVLIAFGIVLVAVGTFYAFHAVNETTANSTQWLKLFFDRMALLQEPLLPNQWISEGIAAAAEGRYSDAGFCLFVTGANALFLSWLAVLWVSSRLTPAFAKAQAAAGQPLLGSVGRGIVTGLAGAPFVLLPRPLRLLARKDIRCFLRDPVQWSQMVILLGLLALYVSNVGRLGGGIGSGDWVLLITFLNLTAVSLILATFTSRFVYPLVSLEGQQFWLLGLLPLRRNRILWAKFAYATTITLVSGLLVTAMSVRSLAVGTALVIAQFTLVSSVCVGLCGTAVGLGACWPVFSQRNAARIASSFGGTINLIVSVILVVVTLAGVAAAGVFARIGGGRVEWSVAGVLLSIVVLFNIVAAGVAMTAGIRRFRRIEF